MRKILSSPKKALVVAGAALVSVLPLATASTQVSAAASTRISVKAPAPYERWAGVANQWTRNFYISGPRTTEVTVGVTVGTPGSKDTLSITFTNRLTLSYGFSSWKNVKNIAFSGQIGYVNYALASMKLNGSSAGKSTMKVFVTAFEPNLSFMPANGHFYEFVSSRGIKWTDAKVAAEAMTFRGVNGYLATVTDAPENNFVSQSIPRASNVWLGGSDAGQEGVWKWETGPEKGTTFMTMTCATKTGDDACNGANVLKTPGSASVQYSDIATGDIASKKYTNWAFQEPNNWGSTGEHYVATNWQGTVGEWNDLADNTAQINGYVVEYSGKFGKLMPQVYTASTVITKVPVRYTPLNLRVVKRNSNLRGIYWSNHEAVKPVATKVVALPSGRVVCANVTKVTFCSDKKASSRDRRYVVTHRYANRPTAVTFNKAFSAFVTIPK